MLIGITGYAQHGKDTAARVFVEDFGFHRVAFADALKDLAYEVNPHVPGIASLQSLVDSEGWEKAKQWPEVRRILQDLGVGARDIISSDVWVQAAERTILDSGAANVVISDVRFPNEAAYVYRNSGQLWRVSRPDFDNGVGTDHPSEAYVSGMVCNTVLMNMGTLEEFEAEVRRAAGERLGEVPTGAN